MLVWHNCTALWGYLQNKCNHGTVAQKPSQLLSAYFKITLTSDCWQFMTLSVHLYTYSCHYVARHVGSYMTADTCWIYLTVSLVLCTVNSRYCYISCQNKIFCGEFCILYVVVLRLLSVFMLEYLHLSFTGFCRSKYYCLLQICYVYIISNIYVYFYVMLFLWLTHVWWSTCFMRRKNYFVECLWWWKNTNFVALLAICLTQILEVIFGTRLSLFRLQSIFLDSDLVDSAITLLIVTKNFFCVTSAQFSDVVLRVIQMSGLGFWLWPLLPFYLLLFDDDLLLMDSNAEKCPEKLILTMCVLWNMWALFSS